MIDKTDYKLILSLHRCFLFSFIIIIIGFEILSNSNFATTTILRKYNLGGHMPSQVIVNKKIIQYYPFLKCLNDDKNEKNCITNINFLWKDTDGIYIYNYDKTLKGYAIKLKNNFVISDTMPVYEFGKYNAMLVE